jgi:hypothetical protein
MEKMEIIMVNASSSLSSAAVLHNIWLYIDLLRVEALMINDSTLKLNILKQK